LDSHVEDLCKMPADFSLTVREIGKQEREYLAEVKECFWPTAEKKIEASFVETETDLIRDCFDSMVAWKTHLPAAALSTKRTSDDCTGFQKLMGQKVDPIHLLFDRFPRLFGHDLEDYDSLIKDLKKYCTELREVSVLFEQAAALSLMQAFAPYLPATQTQDVRKVAAKWAECLPEELEAEEEMSRGGKRAFLKAIRAAMKSKSTSDFINTLWPITVRKPVKSWDDTTLVDFETQVKNKAREIEEIAFHSYKLLGVKGLKKLAGLRLLGIRQALSEAVGEEEALRVLTSLLEIEQGSGESKGRSATSKKGTNQADKGSEKEASHA